MNMPPASQPCLITTHGDLYENDKLSIRTCFESGNATIIRVVESEDVLEIQFAATPTEAPEASWFNFKVQVKQRTLMTKLRCVLHFYETQLGGHIGIGIKGFAPVYCTEAGNEWRRINNARSRHSESGLLLIEWELPTNEGEVQTALSYPYTSEDANTLLHNVAPRLKVEAIGVTGMGSAINRLYNQAKPKADQAALKPPGVYCLARQHASETPAAWVLDGFLREMVRRDDAPMTWAVPFVDVDGCRKGNPGKDSHPWDFNRAWGSKLYPQGLLRKYGSHPMRHEVKCIQYDMQRWVKQCNPLLVIDFHSPIVGDMSGMFLFLRKLTEDMLPDEQHRPFIDLIAAKLPKEFRSDKFVRSGQYPSRWSTARLGDFANDALNVPSITIETPYARSMVMTFSIENYQCAGKLIAESICDAIATSSE
tara:strand:+ start:2874 stop:4142 length:1269 start_codon:yes stop_codon:yes gene_type:complete